MSKREETRQFILEKAAPIFNTKGIAATAMSDIMEVTKLSKGSMYVHFENKDELAKYAFDYNIDQLSAKLTSAIGRACSAKEKLMAYLEVLGDPLNPPVVGGCPLLNFGMEADDTNEVIKSRVNDAVKYSQQIISDIIQEGIRKGEFNPCWNYTEFATIMFAMIEGGLLICRVAGNDSKMKVIAIHLQNMIAKQSI